MKHKQLIRTVSVTSENSQLLILKYFVCERRKSDVLAVSIEKYVVVNDNAMLSEEATISCDSPDIASAILLAHKLAKCTVTPTTLNDIDQDMTYAFIHQLICTA